MLYAFMQNNYYQHKLCWCVHDFILPGFTGYNLVLPNKQSIVANKPASLLMVRIQIIHCEIARVWLDSQWLEWWPAVFNYNLRSQNATRKPQQRRVQRSPQSTASPKTLRQPTSKTATRSCIRSRKAPVEQSFASPVAAMYFDQTRKSSKLSMGWF